MNAISQSSKSSIIFDNEHQIECFTPQNQDESLLQWRQRYVFLKILFKTCIRDRLTLRAAIWYNNHLDMSGAAQVDVILVTDDIEVQ